MTPCSSRAGCAASATPTRSGPPARDDFSPWLYRNADVLADALGFGLKRVTADVDVEGFHFDLQRRSTSRTTASSS